MKHAHHLAGLAIGFCLTICACAGKSSGGTGGAGNGGDGGRAGIGTAVAAAGDSAVQGGMNASGGKEGAKAGQAGDGMVGGGTLGAGAAPGGATNGGATNGGATEGGQTAAGSGGAAGSAGGDSVVTETLEIVGDTSWRTYGTAIGEAPPAGWNAIAFDDSSWVASVAPNPAACGTYDPIQSWDRVNEPMWDISNQYSAFFRKVVTLPEGATVNYAKITSFADDDIAIWVNGVEVFVEANFGVVAGGVIEPHEIDLKPFFVPGANLIAIHAQDTVGGGCRWAIVSGSVEETHAVP